MFAYVTLADVEDIAMERHPLQRRTTQTSRRLTGGEPCAGTSNYETETAVKFRLNWSKEFFSGYE